MVNGAQLLNSKQQQGINAALNALLGSSTRPAMQEAFPGTECDMHSLVQQLDLRIAPEGEQTSLCQCQIMALQSCITMY